MSDGKGYSFKEKGAGSSEPKLSVAGGRAASRSGKASARITTLDCREKEEKERER